MKNETFRLPRILAFRIGYYINSSISIDVRNRIIEDEFEEEKMKPTGIAEHLMFTTIRLLADNGTCGTGYFFNFMFENYSVPVIITNKHVVNHNPYESMTFQVHLTEDGETDEGNHSVKLDTHWHFHSTKDLCFTYCQALFQEIPKITGKSVFHRDIDTSLIYDTERLKNLSIMEPVVMIGYPNGLWDYKNNYPIFRYGFTASHPGYDFNEDGIGLIDAACFPGSSGSPIFILNEGGYREKDGKTVLGPSRIIFLGTLFAGPHYDAEGRIVIKNIAEIPVAQTKMMLNLGCYIKAYEIKEFEETIKQELSRLDTTFGNSC